MGAREHPRIVASYGGEYKDAKTERLVARITGALTAVSENPNQSYRITILNSPAINAFALPGGYLYVTRGLLALANDASEVAAVLSHEMAHVTANHGIERQKKEEAEVIAGEFGEGDIDRRESERDRICDRGSAEQDSKEQQQKTAHRALLRRHHRLLDAERVT